MISHEQDSLPNNLTDEQILASAEFEQRAGDVVEYGGEKFELVPDIKSHIVKYHDGTTAQMKTQYNYDEYYSESGPGCNDLHWIAKDDVAMQWHGRTFPRGNDGNMLLPATPMFRTKLIK